MISFVVENGTGLPNATSYVSVEEADDIAALNIHSAAAWDALTDSDKQSLLMFVSRALDARTTWEGARVSSTQGLEWPRTDVVDRYNNAVASNVVPYNVRWAVVELAKWTMASDKMTNSVPSQAVSEVKIDSVSVKFADAPALSYEQFAVPDIVTDLLKGLATVRNSAKKVTFGKVMRV